MEAIPPRYLVQGREDFGHRAQEDVQATVDCFMNKFEDPGKVSWQEFADWNRANSLEDLMKKMPGKATSSLSSTDLWG